MTSRRDVLKGMAAGLGLASFGVSAVARAETTLRIAVAPAQTSPWGVVLDAMNSSVAKSTSNQVALRLYYDGGQGQELDVIRKLRIGQVDGAALSCAALSELHSPVAGLALPGLFGSWAKLDEARAALTPELEKGLLAVGYTVLGWGDLGEIRRFGAGFSPAGVSEVKAQKVAVTPGDQVAALMCAVLGITPNLLSLADIVKSASFAATTSYLMEKAASSRFNQMSTDVMSYSSGALVVRSDALKSLTADQLKTLSSAGTKASAALNARVRKDDSAATARLKAKMTVVTPSTTQAAEWSKLYASVQKEAALRGLVSKDLLSKLQSYK